MDGTVGFRASNRSIYPLEGGVKGVCGWRFKNCEIWDVFNYYGTTIEDMGKQIVALDSGHKIGPQIIFN